MRVSKWEFRAWGFTILSVLMLIGIDVAPSGTLKMTRYVVGLLCVGLAAWCASKMVDDNQAT